MFKPVLALAKFWVALAEVLLVLGVVLACLTTGFLVRLAQGPLDVGFAKKYIQDALSTPDQAVLVTLNRAALSWPDVTGPFVMNLNGLDIRRNGQTILAVDDSDLAVDRSSLLLGQIRPERLTLNTPALTLVRQNWDQFQWALAVPNVATSSALPMASILLGSNGLLSKVQELDIRQARLHVVDHTLGMTWGIPRVNLSVRAVDVGLLMKVDLSLPGDQTWQSQLTYQKQDEKWTLDGRFEKFSLARMLGYALGQATLLEQKLPLTGNFRMTWSQNKLQELSLQADLADKAKGHLTWDSHDWPIDTMTVRAAYDQDTDTVDIGPIKMTTPAGAVSFATRLQKNDTGYQGPVTVTVGQLDHAQLVQFWPADQRDQPLARWLLDKMSGSQFKNVVLTTPLQLTIHPFTVTAETPTLTADFSDLDLRYHPTLTPLVDASGAAQFADDTLTIKVTGGQVGDLTIKDGSVKIIDVAKAGAGHADVHLTMGGPVRSALDYIALPPIDLPDALPIARDKVKGQGQFNVHVSFPTLADLPKDQVEADVTAVLNDLSLPGLVRGQNLGGGPYDLTVKDGQVHLAGSGTLGGRPITLDFVQPLRGDDYQLTASVDTDQNLRQGLGMDIPFLEGSVPVKIHYQTAAKGTSQADVTADLTPTRIKFSELRYEKAPGQAAQASLKINLRQGTLDKITDLNVTAPQLQIKKGTLQFKTVAKELTLAKATLPEAQIGESRGRLDLTRTPAQFDVKITGQKLDLSPYLSGQSDSSSAPAFTLTADVAALDFGGVEDLRQANLKVVIDQNADIDQLIVTGQAGAGPTSINYVPDAKGRMTLLVTAEDAGAYLRVLDVYDTMQGGQLLVRATPIGSNNRDVKGRLTIRNFKIIKAPVLAQILGALSIKGLGEQLGNDGIGFDRLTSGFALVRRAGADVMAFRDGRTSGSAIGLTFDGIYDRREGQVDIQGTIVPASGLNTLPGKIPLIGKLLTGGDDSALFAATYGIKGPAAKPTTTVNPLSVLAPGILRKMFFEDEPDLDIQESAPKKRGLNR